jgi:hypothetical protein
MSFCAETTKVEDVRDASGARGFLSRFPCNQADVLCRPRLGKTVTGGC